MTDPIDYTVPPPEPPRRTNEQEALDYMRANNRDGAYEAILLEHELGKISVGIVKIAEQSVRQLKQLNVLGKFDDLIAQTEAMMREPVIYIVPKSEAQA